MMLPVKCAVALRVASTLAICAMIAACTSTRAGDGTDRGASAAQTAARTLRLETGSEFPTLNPLVSDNAQLALFAPLFHGYLLRTDADGRFIPDLATDVPSIANGGISDGGRTIRYRLRQGARWHDGVPFDARDVIFSFRAAMNPRNNVPDRSGFDDVISITAPDAYTAVVRLRRPYSPGIATFFNEGANDAYPLLPAHLLEHEANLNTSAYGAQPVGLGPYKVVSWERGAKVVLAADPHYFRGAPKIARAEIAIVPDQNTGLTLWRSGALDVFFINGFGATEAMLRQARQRTGARSPIRDHYQFDYIMFNVAHGPLREAAVRRALVAGIDHEAIMRVLQGPFHRPGDGDRLPGQFAYDPSIRQPRFDLTRARAILDAAGWRLNGAYRSRNGTPLALEIVGVSGTSLSERFMVQLQAQLTKLGIRATIKPYQYTLLFLPLQQGGIYASGRFDLTLYGWQPGEDADHSYLFRCDTRPPGGENYGGICDPAIDRAAHDELTSNDPAVQARGDRAMLRALVDNADQLFLGFNREAVLSDNALLGVQPAITGQHFWNAWSWHWATP